MKTEKICGTCKWHEHNDVYDDWECTNDDSEQCLYFTGYTDHCEEWEER